MKAASNSGRAITKANNDGWNHRNPHAKKLWTSRWVTRTKGNLSKSRRKHIRIAQICGPSTHGWKQWNHTIRTRRPSDTKVITCFLAVLNYPAQGMWDIAVSVANRARQKDLKALADLLPVLMWGSTTIHLESCSHSWIIYVTDGWNPFQAWCLFTAMLVQDQRSVVTIHCRQSQALLLTDGLALVNSYILALWSLEISSFLP